MRGASHFEQEPILASWPELAEVASTPELDGRGALVPVEDLDEAEEPCKCRPGNDDHTFHDCSMAAMEHQRSLLAPLLETKPTNSLG